jgi:hypothetical protein
MGKRKKSRMATTSKMLAEKPPEASIMPVGKIEQAILLIRGEKVILDADLATLYGVGTKVLNQAVKRNINRFPEDFMFQLTWDEAKALRSQIATLNGLDKQAALRSQFVTLNGQDGKATSRSQNVTLKQFVGRATRLLAQSS